MKKSASFFVTKKEKEVIILKRKDITEKIGELNLKIAKANEELDEIELNYKKKRLEIRKYKNEAAGLQLELQELELENCKEIKEKKEITRIQKQTVKKYADINNEYYSQEKNYYNSGDAYKSYIERNVLPYNE